MSVAVLDRTEKAEIREKASKPVLWVGMVSMVMVFAGLTSAYVVRQAEGNWLEFELPLIFYYSTLIIILSSAGIAWSQRSVKKNDQFGVKIGLGTALLLGLGFVYSQFSAYAQLVEYGIFFTGSQSNAAGSFLYVLTGLHLAHLAVGIIVLLVTGYMAFFKEKYSAKNSLGLELCATYWHFLGALWIYLFLFLLFIR